MPYKVKEKNGDFIVVNAETGKPVPGGNHGSDEDKAKRHLYALVKNVKEVKSMAEYDTALEVKSGNIFSIAELEVALETAITNEPINRREGNIEKAELELRHATDFRDAINLLQVGKSLSSEMSNRISGSIKSYLKGGPGSGPRPGGGNKVTLPSKRTKLNLDTARAALEERGLKLGKPSYDGKQMVYEVTDKDGNTEKLSADDIKELLYSGTKRKSFSQLKSAIIERVEELSLKGGPGSGRYPKGSGDNEVSNRFSDSDEDEMARDIIAKFADSTTSREEVFDTLVEEGISRQTADRAANDWEEDIKNDTRAPSDKERSHSQTRNANSRV